MDTRRLLVGYLARLWPRLGKVLGGVVALYVFAVVVLATGGFRSGAGVEGIPAALARDLPLLLGLVLLGVFYSVLGPAFRQTERQVLNHGGDPAAVRTAIRFGQNPLGYAVQSAVRAGVFAVAGVGALGANVRIEAGDPVTVGGVAAAVDSVPPVDLLGIAVLGLLAALAWPYAGGSSYRSNGDTIPDPSDGGDGE